MLKRCIYGLLVIGLGLVLAPQAQAYSGSYTPDAGITGSPHDLSATNQTLHVMNYPATPADGTLDRKCIWCHAPHNTFRLSTASGGLGPLAPAAFDYLPLWNHNIASYVTTGFVMYDNGAGPLTGPKALQAKSNMTPGNVSLLCLSCHDGSIAVNSYGNGDQLARSISNGANNMVGAYQIGAGKYLGNHHPIGFNYGLVSAVDTEIRDADSWFMTATQPISSYLSNGKMECSTCHSVHNKGNPGGETLLWRSDQNSELCLTCHDKGQYTNP